MFALLRSFSSEVATPLRRHTFQVLQWDESEDNQVFCFKFVLLSMRITFSIQDQCTTAPVDEYFDRYEMWHQPEYCDSHGW